MSLHRSISRSGMILGIVLLSLILLAAFVFTYHQVVTQSNRRAHHERIVEAINRVSYAGANLVAEYLSSGIDVTDFLRNYSPELFSINIPPDKKIPGPGAQNPRVRDLIADINVYVEQLDSFKQSALGFPRCTGLSIDFEQLEQIIPANHPAQDQGRDPVEKRGEAVIMCTVECQGLIRSVEVRRQFRLVSMIPGAFCRFSLFAPYTPDRDSFNSVGVKYTGEIDPGYAHPSPRPFSGVLKVFNGTDSFQATVPNSAQDLENRGWIFLGPSHTPSSSQGEVLLKIPAGYESEAGGHFLFARPLERDNPEPPPEKQLVVPEEKIEDQGFNLQAPGIDSAKIVGKFVGFYTYSANKDKPSLNAAQVGLWKNLSSPQDCTSSWVSIFGDCQAPSRTLVIGNVHAGFLKFFAFLGKIAGVECKQKIGPQYEPTVPINGDKKGPIWQDVFQSSLTHQKVVPVDFSTRKVPYNSFFDTLDYPGSQPGQSNWGYPPFAGPGYCPILGKTPALSQSPGLLPEPAGFQQKGGIHPSQITLLRSNSAGRTPDNIYYSGDLSRYSLSLNGPIGERVSHEIDLTNCKSPQEEAKLFRSKVFCQYSQISPPLANRSPLPTGNWYVPKKPGIYLIRRKPGTTAPLAFPQPMFLAQSVVFLVPEGDVEIPGTILSPLDQSNNGAPVFLCSIVAMDGNISLSSREEIDAYLVALKKGHGSSSPGGRLLAGSSQITCFKLIGGLAAWEIGRYPGQNVRNTMDEFPHGGIIVYNPWFNLGRPGCYDESRNFLLEDKPRTVVFRGGIQ